MKHSGPNNIFLWKYKSNESEKGNELLVLKSEEAAIVKDKKVYDVFAEGEWSLTNGSLPILEEACGSDIVDKENAYEVYFINKGYIANILWGTGEPVSLTEAEAKQTIIRLQGECNIRVADSKKYLQFVLKQEKCLEQDECNKYLRKILLNDVRDNLFKVCQEQEISLNTIENSINQIAFSLLEISRETLEKKGLEVLSLSINQIIKEDVSIEEKVVPVEAEAIPVEVEAIPVEVEAISVEAEAIPVEAEAIPVEAEAIPVEAEAIPVEAEAIPVEAEVIPVEAEAIPVEVEAILVEAEAIPVEAEVIPVEAEVIPVEVTKTQPERIFCVYCGARVRNGKFCNVCGKPIQPLVTGEE